MAVVSFAEALEIVRTHAAEVVPSGQEKVSLLQSAGRVLASPVHADRDQPAFDRSTRDGFAVRAQDWNSHTPLRLLGQVRAGQIWNGGEIPPTCAVEIMTGAPVPGGVDAVAMIEHASVSAGSITAAPDRTLQPGDNIVRRGTEAKAGDSLLPAGTLVGASEIALAASCGKSRLMVYRRPQVAVVATGDELVALEDTPELQQIRNSNSYGIAALVEAAGGSALRLPVARDRREDVHERVAQGLASDLLVLSGGVSAGKFDVVEEVLAELDAEFLFTGVRMQPGKPVVFGRVPKPGSTRGAAGWAYFFGLPGNPVSTQVTFQCFAEPLLRAFAGCSWTGPRFARATCGEDVAARPGLTRVLPARMTCSVENTEVRMVSWQGSGDLAANARANCYAVLPEQISVVRGDSITVLLR